MAKRKTTDEGAGRDYGKLKGRELCELLILQPGQEGN